MRRGPCFAALVLLLSTVLGSVSPGHATRRTVVLVADLAASKVAAEDAATLSDLLRGELARERKFVLVQRREMETIAREMEFQMSGCTEQSCAVQMGQMLNAEKVVVGRVAKLFGRLTISAQVVDLAANDIEFAEAVDCAEEYAAVKAAVATLAQKLSAHVPLLAEIKGVNGDTVVLDAGRREGLTVGRRLGVQRTVLVKDAQGKPLMEKTLTVGTLELTYVGPRNSEARSTDGALRAGDYVRIGRGAPAPASAALAAPKPSPPPAPVATPVPVAEEAPPAPERRTDQRTGMQFVCLDGGTYPMGSVWGDGWAVEKPVHPVTLSDFCIGVHEVTQAQWQEVMESNPAYFTGAERPVENVSWHDVQTFIRKLSASSGASYRLPTEAEWEYAARSGGREEKWAGTSDPRALGRYAWFSENSSRETHPVGRREANGLGLHDMSGNVWEWVLDWKGDYTAAAQRDPTGPRSAAGRVLRGGAWNSGPRSVRTTFRNGISPDYKSDGLGFRLVLEE